MFGLSSRKSSPYQPPKFITNAYPPNTPVSSNVVLPLSKSFFKNPNDRLLVGENENGIPVEIPIGKLVEYFYKEAHNHWTEGMSSGHAYFQEQARAASANAPMNSLSLHIQRNGMQYALTNPTAAAGPHNLGVTQLAANYAALQTGAAAASTTTTTNNGDNDVETDRLLLQSHTVPVTPPSASERITILGSFVVTDQDLVGHSARRLFIADDVSLGTVMAEELYFPNPLVKQDNPDCPWNFALAGAAAAVGTNTTAEEKIKKTNSLPPRFLTPWILVGECGTFSDEHEEPLDLHVWVHLFAGSKLWFVERKDDNAVSTFAKAKEKGAAKNNDTTEWDMFLQRAGETIVVPPRLRHFVLNVEPSFAVAQNFVG